MSLVYSIQIRVTLDERERIKRNAKQQGFLSTSGYLRFLGLTRSFDMEEKLRQVHQHLLGTPQKGVKKNPAASTPSQ